MSHSGSKTALGFLTVRNNEESGLIGGYLILNEVGRPLEFHCTAPVKPNRAQQILFLPGSPTLEPFLYGEQIGRDAVGQGSSVEPLSRLYGCRRGAGRARLCQDARSGTSVLVREVVPDGEAIREADSGRSEPTHVESDATWRLDAAHTNVRLATFSLGNNRLAVYQRHRRDQDDIQQRLAALADFDLAEPFERIREALEEAHKQSRV